MSCKFALMVALALPLATAASAQSRSGAEETACRHDAAHFCKGVSDDFRVRDCLVAQKRRISAGCRMVLESHGY